MNDLARGTESSPVILITGGARRVGACIASHLHELGARVIIHYRNSEREALDLNLALQAQRPHSTAIIQGNLLDMADLARVAREAVSAFGRLDGLVNNASSFYPTTIGAVDENQWNDLVGSNMKAPFFLSQALAPELRKQTGAIVNIADVHGERPMKQHTVYAMAKAGLVMMTRSLARELGPETRVNAVAPGAILWPEIGMRDEIKQTILDRTALKRAGQPRDIAEAVAFLLFQAPYVTGQILAVDGGRSLNI